MQKSNDRSAGWSFSQVNFDIGELLPTRKINFFVQLGGFVVLRLGIMQFFVAVYRRDQPASNQTMTSLYDGRKATS